MDNIPTYIERKFGREEVVYLDDKLAPILDETYGVIIYQEQVMQIAQELAGYSLGRSRSVAPRHGQENRCRNGQAAPQIC